MAVIASFINIFRVPELRKKVLFTLNLDAGEARVQTAFHDANGPILGAYYVYVERLSRP